MMEFESIDELHMHFARELASWHITREEYDCIDEMIKAVEKDVSKRIEEAEAFAKRVQEAVESHEEVTLFGIDYMPLPVDANGVPIRVGDVIAYEDNTKPKEVVALVPPSIFMVEDGPRLADSCRHYHAPTVEDVLDEFASAYDRIGGEDDEHQKYLNLIAEFAAKLRAIIEGSKGPEWQETDSQDEGR